MSGFLQGLGVAQAARFGLGFLLREASLRKFISWERDRSNLDAKDAEDKEDPGFERFVRERVGESAYQAFYRPYAEKVWGLPAREISTVVAKKRISTAQPLQVLRQALGPAGKPPTFQYPRLGMGALVQALSDEARALGVKVHFGRRFLPTDLEDSRWRYIVYSGNLDMLLPQSRLAHRGLYLLYLAIPSQKLGPLGQVDTFYTPEDCYWFGRVSLPSNFSPELGARGLSDEIVLCVEIPEGRWGRDRDFLGHLDELLEQLRAARILIGSTDILPTAARQVFLKEVYPLYRRGWIHDWRHAMHSATAGGRLLPVGRQGLFLHCNIDHCVQIAADVSAHIVAGGSAQDWVMAADRYLELRVRD
jgi:hypothetical protein